MKFRSAFNRGVSKPEQEFCYVYTWHYFDDKGNLKEDTINQFEAIQSVDVLTPTEMVTRGVIPNDSGAVYGDITNLPSDFIGLMDYIRHLQDSLSAVQGKGPESGNREIAEEGIEVTAADSAAAGQKSTETVKEVK